jgi:hypothetical protein
MRGTGFPAMRGSTTGMVFSLVVGRTCGGSDHQANADSIQPKSIFAAYAARAAAVCCATAALVNEAIK